MNNEYILAVFQLCISLIFIFIFIFIKWLHFSFVVPSCHSRPPHNLLYFPSSNQYNFIYFEFNAFSAFLTITYLFFHLWKIKSRIINWKISSHLSTHKHKHSLVYSHTDRLTSHLREQLQTFTFAHRKEERVYVRKMNICFIPLANAWYRISSALRLRFDPNSEIVFDRIRSQFVFEANERILQLVAWTWTNFRSFDRVCS